jgi:hypothetical protein
VSNYTWRPSNVTWRVQLYMARVEHDMCNVDYDMASIVPYCAFVQCDTVYVECDMAPAMWDTDQFEPSLRPSARTRAHTQPVHGAASSHTGRMVVRATAPARAAVGAASARTRPYSAQTRRLRSLADLLIPSEHPSAHTCRPGPPEPSICLDCR